jgi:hypothetical protein
MLVEHAARDAGLPIARIGVPLAGDGSLRNMTTMSAEPGGAIPQVAFEQREPLLAAASRSDAGMRRDPGRTT